MSERFDAYVIGAGPAGTVCAGELADGGMKVGLAERELVGGECSYWACIPSKTLLRPGDALTAARRVPGAREAAQGRLDPAAALAWRDWMVSDHTDDGAVGWLDDQGIDLVRGSAELLAPGRVRVGSRELTADHVVVATGSDPVLPPIPGLRELDGVWTSREATALTEVPRRLLILGGGPVGLEIAQAVHRMGGDVT